MDDLGAFDLTSLTAAAGNASMLKLNSGLLSGDWPELASQLAPPPPPLPPDSRRPSAPGQPQADSGPQPQEPFLLPSAGPRPGAARADGPSPTHLISPSADPRSWHGEMTQRGPGPALTGTAPAAGEAGAGARPLAAAAINVRPPSLTVQSVGDVASDPLVREALQLLCNVERLNILVAGQTGAGKTTLIGAMLGQPPASTQPARPATGPAEWVDVKGTPLRLMDTAGIAPKDYQETLQMVQIEADQARRAYDIKEQPHLGWVCVSTLNRRVQDCDVELVRMFNRMEIPVVVVLTKDDDDPHFAKLVNLILSEQGASVQAVVSVRAIAAASRPPAGLGKLMMATVKALPEKLLAPATAEIDQNKLMAETAKHLRSIGRVNILVAGQTGVGKSTLINAVFGESFAQTAAGRPVTQHAEWYSSPTVPLRILDTKGLEAKDYESTVRSIRQEIERARNATDTKDQLHIGWVCISTQSSRVQDCEIDIIRLLNRYEIPAIVVLTKDDDDPNFPDIVACIMAKQRAYCRGIVPVRAVARRSFPAAGLENLVMATYKALPDAHRSAFAAAQKINRDLNRKAAEDYVNAAAVAAAAASVIPIPLVDLATLAPIQAGMMLGISSAFGLTLDRHQIMQVITTTLGTLAVSFAGKWAVGNVLKFIPGPGTVVGSALNAAVAGAITRGIGTAFIRFLYKFMERNNRAPSADEILDVFPTFYKMGEA